MGDAQNMVQRLLLIVDGGEDLADRGDGEVSDRAQHADQPQPVQVGLVVARSVARCGLTGGQ